MYCSAIVVKVSQQFTALVWLDETHTAEYEEIAVGIVTA
jgi:hypothetical protein